MVPTNIISWIVINHQIGPTTSQTSYRRSGPRKRHHRQQTRGLIADVALVRQGVLVVADLPLQEVVHLPQEMVVVERLPQGMVVVEHQLQEVGDGNEGFEC